MTPNLRRAAAPLLLVALVLAAHLWELNGEPVFDDSTYIVDNPAVQGGLGDWRRFFVDPTTYSALASTVHYRPLVVLSYAANAAMGSGTTAYKLTQVAFHALAVLGLFWALTVLRRHRPEVPRAVPFTAAAWVGVAPFNVEAVHYMSARSALMCGMFAAWAFGFYLALRRETRPARMAGLYVAHLAMLAAALVSKETALTLPAAMLAADLLVVRPPDGGPGRRSLRWWWPYLPYLAGLGLVLWRMPNVHNIPAHLQVVFGSGWRLSTAFYCLVENVRLMVLPTGLTVVHPIDPGARLTSPTTLVAVAVAGALLAWAWRVRRRDPAVAFGWAWYFLLIAPSTFVQLNVPLLENRGYTASFGVGLVLAVLGCRLGASAGRYRRAAVAGLAAVALLLVALTIHAERVWATGLALWTHAVARDPQAAGARANLGLMHLQAGRPGEAEADFRWVLAQAPDFFTARSGLARALTDQGRYDEAVGWLRPLVEQAPDDPRLLFELARTYVAGGRTDDALATLRRLAEAEVANARSRTYEYRYAPTLTATEILRLALRAGRLDDARWAVAHLRQVAPGDPQVDYLDFRVALASADWAGAGEALDRLARRYPGDARIGPLRARLEAARRGPGPVPGP